MSSGITSFRMISKPLVNCNRLAMNQWRVSSPVASLNQARPQAMHTSTEIAVEKTKTVVKSSMYAVSPLMIASRQPSKVENNIYLSMFSRLLPAE